MNNYIVGIDFGHGETAAWVLPLSGGNPTEIDKEKGGALKLKLSNEVNDRVLDSEIFVTPSGNYSLTQTPNSAVRNQMKKKISELNEEKNKDKKEAYKAYIKCVVERLLEANAFLKKENTQFKLYMASPTSWTDDEKKEYLNFFNEAISSLNLRFESVIGESDAAFFSKVHEISNVSKSCLVIDYGSSTIDYTLMKGGKKISDDKWSSGQLGASCIEDSFIIYGKEEDYEAYNSTYNAAQNYLHEHHLEHHDIASWLKRECRIAKHTAYKAGGPVFNIDFPIIKKITSDKTAIGIRFEIDGNVNDAIKTYKEDVKKDLLSFKQKIYEKDERHDPNDIILSGGACIMPWFRILVSEVFPHSNIIVDDTPSYVVAEGVAKYAKAQMEAQALLMSDIEAKDFANMYKDAFAEANHQAMCQLSGAVVQDITNSAPITGESIRQRFCYFIQGLNPQNVAFSQMLQKNFNNALSFEIRKIIKTAIKEAFGINADVSDIKVDLPIKALQWDKKSISPGGGFYEEITYTIENYKTFSFNFEWDKTRDRSKATEIARKVQTYLNEIDFAHETIYPEEYLRDYGENLKQIAKAEAYKLFVDKQLFKTTFTA